MKGKKFELYVCDLMDSRIEMWQARYLTIYLHIQL